MNQKKPSEKIKMMIIVLGVTISLAACANKQNLQTEEANYEEENRQEQDQMEPDDQKTEIAEEAAQTVEDPAQAAEETTQTVEEQQVINEQGMSLAERILTPEGYTRTDTEEGSLAAFLRDYPLKEAGAEVLLYDGSPKGNQGAHIAVFHLPIENYDLQQCADSVIRVYAEYFWETGQYERISFHFTNGFLAEYVKWRDGYRINVNGNDVSWSHSKAYDDSYECFVQYLKMVFAYAGTLSLETEAGPIASDEIEIGDIFLHGASPGHVVMIVDACQDSDGKKAFLLAQGYMPAQEFHVLKNERHEDDPWYYEDEIEYPFQTPEYTFAEGELKHPEY